MYILQKQNYVYFAETALFYLHMKQNFLNFARGEMGVCLLVKGN